MSNTIFTSHIIANDSQYVKSQRDKYYCGEDLILEVEDSYSWPKKGDFVKIGNDKFFIQSVCFDPIELIQEFTLIKLN